MVLFWTPGPPYVKLNTICDLDAADQGAGDAGPYLPMAEQR